MFNDINNLPILKEIEQKLFRELQEVYQATLVSILEETDIVLRDNRDFKRFKNHERQKCTIATMFGSITINRRKYKDNEKGNRVALLDKYLQFKGNNLLSPFLTEMAVDWAVRSPSYRDSKDRFCDLLGYQVMSHEKIRQEVLEIEPKDFEEKPIEPKKVDVLFLEVDGLHVHKQNSTRKTREIKLGIVHEGWERKHPSSKEYALKNKSYWHTLEKSETFWEEFSRYLYAQYEMTKNTHIVINGDAAPWIRTGVEYFENAIYTYDRYHLKKWIKDALRKRSKQERRQAYLAADANDPVALIIAIAETEKEETDEEKKAEISDLRLFILENQEAFRDYRKILKEKKDVDVSEMRPMGAAESNVNLFSRRLKKMGYSWSSEGLEGMVSAMIHRFEGTLLEAIQQSSSSDKRKGEPIAYPSFASLLTEKTSEAIGAIKGHLLALVRDDQGQPYTKALRGLAGF